MNFTGINPHDAFNNSVAACAMYESMNNQIGTFSHIVEPQDYTVRYAWYEVKSALQNMARSAWGENESINRLYDVLANIEEQTSHRHNKAKKAELTELWHEVNDIIDTIGEIVQQVHMWDD